MYVNVLCSPVYNRQDMEATWMSINRWMDKEDVVHIGNEVLLSHKKGRISVTCSEVNKPRVCYTEWRNSEREKQILYIMHMYGIKKKKIGKINLLVWKEWQRRCKNRLVDTVEGGEGGTNWESSADVYTRLCVKQIARGSHCRTQGAQSWAPWWPRGMGTYTYNYDSASFVRQKPAQHCKVIILQIKKCKN